MNTSEPITFVILGASGDLARRKVIPAFFALYCQDKLPPEFRVVGFGRSELTDEAFRQRVMEHLACRYSLGPDCARREAEYLARCFFVTGSYDSRDAYLDLYTRLREIEPPGAAVNRVFYMAIPPDAFLDVSHGLGDAALIACDDGGGWTRVVVEKPFGRDRASSDALVRGMSQIFSEAQTYRIDHYLGKELVQDLMVLRFANAVFEPLWNARHIERVSVLWRETDTLAGRAGYFDRYGILRDVVQNHLLQIVALAAMEPPSGLNPVAVHAAKAQLLRSIQPLAEDDLVLGQYAGGTRGNLRVAGYREEAGVPADSCTPTFAAGVLTIDNERWRGVPFFLLAGKGAARSVNELRIQFRRPAADLFGTAAAGLPANELVVRIQPDEAIGLRVLNKTPGLAMKLQTGDLNLSYSEAYPQVVPEAYERLLLDVIAGEHGLFICADELAASWDVVTPVLHAMEESPHPPEAYALGGDGPASTAALAARWGFPWPPPG